MSDMTDHFNWPNASNLVKFVVPFSKIVLVSLGNERDFEVLKRRFGLEGSKSYTLQEVGDYYDISRERVRQIEERAKRKIGEALLGSETACCKVPEDFTEEVNNLRSLLREADGLLTEREITKIVEERYDFVLLANESSALRFLLAILDFSPLPRSSGFHKELSPSWMMTDDLNKSRLHQALKSVYRTLLTSVVPQSLFDLKVKVNRRRKKKIETVYIRYAIKICAEIERVDQDLFQMKFGCLSSLADKAYRILYEVGKPMHLRDIWREINHRLVKEELSADALMRSIQQQLVDDPRFEPAGRSGGWSLSEWEHVRRETILKLMQEFFHLKQSSATSGEIYEFVCSKREGVSKKSVHVYLTERKDLFARISKHNYELAAWGGKVYKPEKSSRSQSVRERLELEIKAMFVGKKVTKIPLSQLVYTLAERTGISVGAIYSGISRVSVIELEPDPSHRRKKVAKYVESDEQIATVAPLRKTLREIVHRKIESFLADQPGTRVRVADVAAYVMKTTNCKKTTFYRYLSEMENVRKEYGNDNKLYCYHLETEEVAMPLSFPQVEQIKDEVLRRKLDRAVRNLTIDDIDLGLFELGRIFENELRAFLLDAQKKGIFQVSGNDLKRLVSMISCVERNGIITKKHHLTLLREQRNERAHGEIPDLAERRRLMQYAPFFGDLYIDYIILFHDKREEL